MVQGWYVSEHLSFLWGLKMPCDSVCFTLVRDHGSRTGLEPPEQKSNKGLGTPTLARIPLEL